MIWRLIEVHISPYFNLIPTWPERVLGTALMALGLWYVHDMMVPRKVVYGHFGLEEPIIQPIIRHLRLTATVFLSLIGLGILLATKLGVQADQILHPAQAGPLGILAAASLATLGWIFTNYQNQKNANIANTIGIMRDVFHTSRYPRLRLLLGHSVKRVRAFKGVDQENPTLPDCLYDIDLRALFHPDDLETSERLLTLGNVVDEVLNTLEQIAYGVRSGQLDANTVEMTMRQAFIRNYIVFETRIAESAGARPRHTLKPGEDWRSETPTYEHFLWLVHHLPKKPRDNFPGTYLRPPRVKAWS